MKQVNNLTDFINDEFMPNSDLVTDLPDIFGYVLN